MWSPRRKIGNSAEKIAYKFLQKKHLTLILQNYQSKFGEIDLIMQDNETLVFVEVRYRTNDNFTTSVETVDTIKQQKIIKTAQLFLQEYPQFSESICRFDVVGIENSLKSPTIHWISDAFTL
jgi:putative endonuclease